MKQTEYLGVVDEFSDAVKALADKATPAQKERLRKATGDLITALASQATAQSLSAFGVLLAKLERNEERLAADEERLTDLEERNLEAREV